MRTFWVIILGLVFIYYGYVFLILWRKKQFQKKNPSKLGNLQINNIFVNNSDNNKTDLEAILNQVKEVEDHSKLLDAFKKDSSSEEASYSLTLKKNEKLKIVRDDSASDPTDDPQT